LISLNALSITGCASALPVSCLSWYVHRGLGARLVALRVVDRVQLAL